MQKSKNQMGDGQNVREGEYYDRISKIVTQDEAWDIILSSDAFKEELKERMEEIDNSYEQIRSELEDLWRHEGISFYDGFYKRLDGRVEVRADA